ncbi:MAG: oxidoreductase [Chitinophagia bacterium]|nr:oxidoreductase [Chitinophagia bacterium]
MKPFLLSLGIAILLVTRLQAQSVETLRTGRNTSLRGLCVVDDSIAWVSGSRGSVGRSLDGGRSWTWLTVPGFESSDFRDIEAWDARTAVIMAVAEPAWILRTEDGGAHWKVVYTDTTRGVFLDAMHFLPYGRGVCVGDPLGGRLYELRTVDSGRSWTRTPAQQSPVLEDGEAFFASSGSNALLLPEGRRLAVTGGRRSRFLDDDRLRELPLRQGGTSTGANSLTAWGRGKRMVAVGGDFAKDRDTTGTSAISRNGGRSWHTPETGPNGYRSSVVYLGPRQLIACGTSGIDLSTDGGMHWKELSREGFHACAKAKQGRLVLLAGSGGRIARYTPE